MAPDQSPQPFTCSLRVVVSPDGDRRDAQAAIDPEALSLSYSTTGSAVFPLRQIESIEVEDYTIRLILEEGESILLRDLGFRFEDFLRALHRRRNEVILADLLASETIRTPDLETAFVYTAEPPAPPQSGKGWVRLYETSLAIMPELGEIVKIPLGCIDGDISLSDHRLRVPLENRGEILFGKMGNRLDFLKRSLEERFDELAQQTGAALSLLVPELDPALLRIAAALFRDGRAVTRARIEGSVPGIWTKLAERVDTSTAGALSYLLSRGAADQAAAGCKRGLMGGLTGEMIWFLIPIPAAHALAMEAVTVLPAAPAEGGESHEMEGGGKATYFFRLGDAPDNPAGGWTARFNRAFLSVNFRREPIYLQDEKLREPRYEQYRFSLKRLPELRMLRKQFIGRIPHRTPEQWQTDSDDLLAFAAAASENERWQKGD